MNKPQLLLALDFGGTKHTAAVLAPGERRWARRRQVLSPPNPDARYDLDSTRSLARELLAGAKPAAIGVSFGGPVNAASGIVHLSHHVPGWENTPLQAILETEFSAPARVDNDANVAALGEHRFGAGQGHNSLLYITVSTGVGGGWILDNQIWHGAQGMAGEIGHSIVDPDGPVCVCGKRGCLERLASGPFIAQRAREWLEEQPDRGRILRTLVEASASSSSEQAPLISSGQAPLISSGQAPLISSGHGLEGITAQLVSQAAAQGDELAWEALKVAAWALGIGIGNAANLVNPQRTVLGGGVTKAGERFWEEIRRVARETAVPEIHLDIVPAALGDDAPLWGAVALAEDCLLAVQPTD